MGKLEKAGGRGSTGKRLGRKVKELNTSIVRNGIGQEGGRGRKRREGLRKPEKGKREKRKGTGKEKGGWKDRRGVIRGKQGRAGEEGTRERG